MKKELKTIVAAVALLLGGTGLSVVHAQKVETQSIGVTARLANQLSITKVSDVDFGGIFVPVTASATATMDKAGTVTITNGTTTLYSTELQRAGSFYITADKAATYTLQYPNVVELALTGGGTSKLNYTPALYDKAGTLVPSSAATEHQVGEDQYKLYSIGGNLVIPNTALAGIHTGTFDLTVTWQ